MNQLTLAFYCWLFTLLTFVGACTGQAQTDKANLRTQTPKVIVADSIVYTGSATLEKTLIIAYHDDGQQRPAILHFHGGGFRKGRASRKTAMRIAQAGFVGISINYRLSQEAVFPAAVHDCKTAVRWTRANARRYHIDPDKIGVFGGSAGGYLAAMVGLSGGDDYLEGDGAYPNYSSNVQAVVENYGPSDFLKMNDFAGNIDHDSPTSPESQFIGGAIQNMTEQVGRANPIHYIDIHDPPILILHGRKDLAVPFNQSELLFNALQNTGVPSQLIPVENAGHGFKPSATGLQIEPTKMEIEAMQIAWFKKYL